jgi:hypothetical protein
MRSSEPVKIEESGFTEEALSSLGIPDYSAALTYLGGLDLSKSQASRLIPYFLKLGVIPAESDRWASALTELVQSYASLVELHCPTEDLAAIEAGLPPIVPRDLGRSLPVFSPVFTALGLSLDLFPDPKLRFTRLFAIMHGADTTFVYLQGYDRFAFICAAIVAAFCTPLKVPLTVVDALTYFLTRAFISKLDYGYIITDHDRAAETYAALTIVMERVSPATASALKSQRLQPALYALNWYLALFSEQHPIAQTLVVWDLIVLNIENREDYVNGLIAAHLNQIQIGLNQNDTIQRIVGAKTFNLERLARDAQRAVMGQEKLAPAPREGVPLAVAVIIPIIVFVVAGWILYRTYIS